MGSKITISPHQELFIDYITHNPLCTVKDIWRATDLEINCCRNVIIQLLLKNLIVAHFKMNNVMGRYYTVKEEDKNV